MISGLTVGRVVHYVMPNGEHRPAFVVRVWNKDAGTSNLQVFTDGQNDGTTTPNVMWVTSVNYSEEKMVNSWHWIEKED